MDGVPSALYTLVIIDDIRLWKKAKRPKRQGRSATKITKQAKPNCSCTKNLRRNPSENRVKLDKNQVPE